MNWHELLKLIYFVVLEYHRSHLQSHNRSIISQIKCLIYVIFSSILFYSLADPELQKRGAKFFSNIFERPFFRRFPKNFSISPKNFIYLPKFLMTFFSRRSFSCFIVLLFWRG